MEGAGGADLLLGEAEDGSGGNADRRNMNMSRLVR